MSENKDNQQEQKEVNASFEYIISIFTTQALLQLGEVQNPVTGKQTADLKGAKFTIDSLNILKEKTKGNLTKEEENHLNNVIYNLQMRFVEHSK